MSGGARYYNEQKGTDVEVLGWDGPDTKERRPS